MADIELNVLIGQCLNRRIDDIEVVRRESLAWQDFRNNKGAKVNWQFTTENAPTKLNRLYPTIEDCHDSSLLLTLWMPIIYSSMEFFPHSPPHG